MEVPYVVLTAEQLLDENQRRLRGVRNCSTSARRYKMAKELTGNYIVLSMETTGMRPGADRIIQIGAIKYDNFQEVGTYRTLINPKRYIPIEVTRRSKITNFLVEDAPVIEDIIETFLSFMDGLPVVMHNAQVYMNFLYATEQVEGVKIPDLSVVDTARLARKTLPIISPQGLEELTAYLQLENEEKDILQSCLTVNDIYQLCAKQLGGPASN